MKKLLGCVDIQVVHRQVPMYVLSLHVGRDVVMCTQVAITPNVHAERPMPNMYLQNSDVVFNSSTTVVQ